MNNVKNFFSRVSANIPKGGAGGELPNAPKGASAGLLVLAGLGAAAYGGYHSMVTVQPGHAGVIYNRFGGLDEKTVLKEGLNFVLPWFQRAIVYDIRTRPQPIDTQSGSKDLQMVQISLRVLFKPDSSKLPAMYRQLGKGK
jgi:prohibitin 2